MSKKDDFDYRPVIPGSAVQIRRLAVKSANEGSEGRLEFSMSHGDGEVDGVEFTIAATIGCNLTVRFKRGTATTRDGERHAYQISASDFIAAAWAIDKELPDDPSP